METELEEGHEAIIAAVEALDPSAGPVVAVTEVTPGPGLANRHFRFDRRSSDAAPLLVKVSRGPLEGFEAEQAGLQALALAFKDLGVVVPRPHTLGPLGEGRGSFLVLDFLRFVPFGPSIPSVLERLGHAFATMHCRGAGAAVRVAQGAHTDSGGGGDGTRADSSWADTHQSLPVYGFGGKVTFLGGTPQDNTPSDNFADFFVERRLRPQLERASLKFQFRYGTSNEANTAIARLYDRVVTRARDVLRPVQHCRPSLLHGDLWTGNAGATPSRQPIVVDPACWYGHAEFDLALSQLFGKFGPRFYDAYFEVAPRLPGYEERQQVYLLYHTLNQANLHGAGFGHGGTAEHPGGYLEKAVACMERLAA